MKHVTRIIMLLSVTVAVVSFSHTDNFKTDSCTEPFVNLHDSNLKITGVEIVDKIIGQKKKTITASRKNACLLELKIEGTAPADGEFGLYPTGFSVYATYRRVNKIFPSIAVGIKPRLPSGEMEEYWLNEPEVSMMVGCKKGESFRFYVLFEVPVDTETFYFQSPEISQRIAVK